MVVEELPTREGGRGFTVREEKARIFEKALS
jgi:hypothetical protein